MDRTSDPVRLAFEDGRNHGFGIAALAVSALTFIHLFGLEKALLGIVLGALTLGGAPRKSREWRFGVAAIGIGIASTLLTVALLVMYGEELVSMLERIGATQPGR